MVLNRCDYPSHGRLRDNAFGGLHSSYSAGQISSRELFQYLLKYLLTHRVYFNNY